MIELCDKLIAVRCTKMEDATLFAELICDKRLSKEVSEQFMYYLCDVCMVVESDITKHRGFITKVIPTDSLNDKYKIIQFSEYLTSSEPILATESTDPISPDHYKSQCSLECIDAMQMAFGTENIYWFCVCNAWKYMWRYKNKNGIEDLRKAEFYLNYTKGLCSLKPEALRLSNILQKLIIEEEK